MPHFSTCYARPSDMDNKPYTNELYYITQLLFFFLLLHWEWNKNWKVANWNLTEQQRQNKKESFLCKNNWSLSEIELIIKALITMIMISNNNKKTNWT